MRQANQRARALRKNMPEGEAFLWTLLRRRKIDGHKFRRQHMIGPFIVDFVCLDRKLVVELDGAQHATPEARAYDARRTEYLKREGFDVLRFWNKDLFENTEGVVERIREALWVPPPG